MTPQESEADLDCAAIHKTKEGFREMKTYCLILAMIAFFVAVFVMIVPRLISMDDDISVTCGFILIAASLPIFFWFSKKIVLQVHPLINQLKELLK